MKQGISHHALSAITDYINCYEEAGYRCDATMLHHFITEKQGKFGKMVDNIKLPSQ